MANDRIDIVLEADQVSSSAEQAAKRIANIVSSAGSAEQKVKALTAELSKLGNTLQGADKPRVLKNIQLAGQAISGAFSEAALKIKAVQGQIQEFSASTLQLQSRILAASNQAGARLAKAAQELQVQKFIGNNNRGFSGDNDLQSLLLRIQAEQRRLNAAAVGGTNAPRNANSRLEALQTQLRSLRVDQAAAPKLLDAALKQSTALNEVERQKAKVLEQEVLYRAELAKSAGAETEAVRAAAAALAEQKAQLQSIQASQKPAAQTPQARAIQTNQNIAARFGLNGGADVFKLQTQILANYQIVNTLLSSIRNAFTFVTGFENALKQLQAITGATNIELGTMAQRFLDVSQNSRFSGTEIAQAATIMGQAGLSAQQINESIEAVVKLATATGTDLTTAVDLATSAMGIFNLRATEMNNVADMVSAALNVSKLDAQKMALGLQYAGNQAAEVGVTFQELTTALALMANAGIKSGSTLGTGLRQVIQELANPSTKLKDALDRLGLTMSDIDIRSQGIFGVLKNLQQAGFTTADAMTTMGTRGAAAFSAFANSIDKVDDLQKAIALTGDASKANAEAMDSVEAQMKRLGSTAGALAVSMSGPLMGGFKEILKILSNLLAGMRDFGGALSVVTTLIGGVAIAALTKWLGGLAVGLLNVKSFIGVLGEMLAIMKATQSVSLTLGYALSVIGKGNLIFLGISAAIAAVIAALDLFNRKGADTAQTLEQLKTSFNDSKGRFDNYEASAKAVGDEIGKLEERHARLTANGDELSAVIAELNNRFKDMGFYVSEGTKNIDDLISKMRELQQQQLLNSQTELKFSESILRQQLVTQQRVAGTSFGTPAVMSAIGKLKGFSFGVPNLPTGAGIETGATVIPSGGPGSAVITKALGFLGGTKIDFNNPASIDAALGSLVSLSKEIADKRQQLQQSLGDTASDATNNLQAMGNVLAQAIKQLQAVKGTASQLHINQSGQGTLGIQTSVLGQRVRDFTSNAQGALSQVESQFTGRDGGKITDQMKRDHAKALADLYTGLARQYQQIVGGLDKATIKAAGGDSANTVLQSIRTAADKAGIDVNQIDLGIAQASRKNILAQISAQNALVNSRTPLNVIASVPDALTNLYAALQEVDGRITEIRKKITAVKEGTESAAQIKNELSETDQTNAAKNIDRAKKFYEEIAKKTKETADRAEQLPVQIKDFSDNFKRITDAYKRGNDAANNLVQQAEARIQGMQQLFNGNRNRISDVEVQRAQNQLPAIEATAAQGRLANTTATISQLQALQEQGAQLRASYAQQAADLDAKIKAGGPGGNGSLTATDLARLGQDRTTALQREYDINSKMVPVEQQIKTLEQERAQLAETIANKYGEQQGTLSIAQGFKESLKQFLDQQGAFRSMNIQIIDSFQTMFQTVQDGFSNMVTDVVTHTKTIGDAVRDMATNILKAMVQVATNKLAAQLLRLVFNALPFGGGATVGEAGGQTTIGAFGASRMGGPIRASMGAYINRLIGGGTPGRDSVPTFTMPGEYVVQKSAVDALGVDFMNRLNSMGPRALDTRIPLPQQDQGGGVVNVWVVSKDNIPPLGPKDIVAHVADNIAKGGTVKQLIKQVQMGTV